MARLQSAAVRVVQADRALRTGIITFNGNFEGLKQTSRFGDVLVLISRPQEAVYALQLLKRAFDEYFTTVAEYNRAQFELFHALGYPAREVAQLRPARRGPAGGHGAAALPAPGGQRAAPGHPMNSGSRSRRPSRVPYRKEQPMPVIGLRDCGRTGTVMKERTAWPSMLAVALLLCWVEPAPCAAQPPAGDGDATTNPTPRRSRAASPASTAPPAIDPVTKQSGQPLPPSLPSAVSSDIERLARPSGRDLPPSTAPPAVNARERPGRPGLAAGLAARAARMPGPSGPAATAPSPLATT